MSPRLAVFLPKFTALNRINTRRTMFFGARCFGFLSRWLLAEILTTGGIEEHWVNRNVWTCCLKSQSWCDPCLYGNFFIRHSESIRSCNESNGNCFCFSYRGFVSRNRPPAPASSHYVRLHRLPGCSLELR